MVRELLGPVWLAVLAGTVIAAAAYGRREAWSSWPRWPFAVLGLAFAVWSVSSARAFGQAWIADVVVVRLVGAGALIAAALAAFLGSRARAKASLLVSQAPRAIEQGIAAARTGAGELGVFEGRLASAEPVAAPSGVLCAFYDAELRALSSSGQRGALLAVDKGHASAIFLRGERCQARVAFAPGSVLARVRVRRCRLSGRLSCASDSVLATGLPPTDALSYERLGKIGEKCLVVGRIVKGTQEGTYLVKGPGGGPALVALEDGVALAGKRLLMRGYGLFSAAASLVVIAAYLLAR
jgi:hypothetical protein